MFAKHLSDEEIAANKASREAEFAALPLIEQIRRVVREEVRSIVADELRLSKMSDWERGAVNFRRQMGYDSSYGAVSDQASWTPQRQDQEAARQAALLRDQEAAFAQGGVTRMGGDACGSGPKD